MNTFVMNPALTIKLGPEDPAARVHRVPLQHPRQHPQLLPHRQHPRPDGTPYGTLIDGRPGTARVLTTPNQRDFRFEGPGHLPQGTHLRPHLPDRPPFSENLQWWGGYSAEDINVRDRSFNIALRNANDASIPLRVRTDPRFLALLRPSAGTAQPQVLDIRPNNITNSARTVRPTWKSELYFAFDTGPVKHRMITGISYGPLTLRQQRPESEFLLRQHRQRQRPRHPRLGGSAQRRHPHPLPRPARLHLGQALGLRAINQYPQGRRPRSAPAPPTSPRTSGTAISTPTSRAASSGTASRPSSASSTPATTAAASSMTPAAITSGTAPRPPAAAPPSTASAAPSRCATPRRASPSSGCPSTGCASTPTR
jgi:hypothetical protein